MYARISITSEGYTNMVNASWHKQNNFQKNPKNLR